MGSKTDGENLAGPGTIGHQGLPGCGLADFPARSIVLKRYDGNTLYPLSGLTCCEPEREVEEFRKWRAHVAPTGSTSSKSGAGQLEVITMRDCGSHVQCYIAPPSTCSAMATDSGYLDPYLRQRE